MTGRDLPDPDGSCWSCRHQSLGGTTFLGRCLWFKFKGDPPKDIPPTVVDRGCKFWVHGRPSLTTTQKETNA